MLQLTGGIGAELAIDAAGFKATCEDAVWSARRGGRMVQVGLPLGGEPPVVPMARVAGREIEIIGAPAWSESAVLAAAEPATYDSRRPRAFAPESVVMCEREGRPAGTLGLARAHARRAPGRGEGRSGPRHH